MRLVASRWPFSRVLGSSARCDARVMPLKLWPGFACTWSAQSARKASWCVVRLAYKYARRWHSGSLTTSASSHIHSDFNSSLPLAFEPSYYFSNPYPPHQWPLPCLRLARVRLPSLKETRPSPHHRLAGAEPFSMPSTLSFPPCRQYPVPRHPSLPAMGIPSSLLPRPLRA